MFGGELGSTCVVKTYLFLRMVPATLGKSLCANDNEPALAASMLGKPRASDWPSVFGLLLSKN